MKRILFSLILALSLALPAAAQVVEDPSTGASISSGSTISGCNAITAILNVVTGALTCNPASVVNGTVSTAGRSILTIRDTVSSGQSMFDLTGTMNGTLSATTSMMTLNPTLATQNQIQSGLMAVLSGTGGTLATAALWGDGNAAGSINGGVVGRSTGSSTLRFGGFFGLGSVVPSGNSFALGADNGAVAADIFRAADNGTAVFTIADGGGITAAGIFSGTSYLTSATGGYFFTSAAVDTGFQRSTVNTPDAVFASTGTTSNSLNVAEDADVRISTFDFQNACTTGLGTSACTDPTVVIHSHNQDTGEFLSMAHDGKAGVIVGGNSTVLDGTIRLGGTVTLTESSATNVLTIPVAVSTATGGEIMYTVEAKDATNTQARRGSVRYAVANNSSGTETCGVYGVDNAVTVNPAETNDGSGAGAITSGTLTYGWTSDTTGTNQCVLKLNAVSSLTQTTFQIHYTVIQSGPGVPTGGD